MDDSIWGTLIMQAKDRALCSFAESTCHVQVIVGPVYARLIHTDIRFHACAFCATDVPEHIVSLSSLQTVKRDALIARIARFFNHAHSEDQRDRLSAAA